MIEDGDVAEIRRAVTTLIEHFDCIQVFVSRYENGDTSYANIGMGNKFARLGQVREWLRVEDLLVQKEVMERKDDDE